MLTNTYLPPLFSKDVRKTPSLLYFEFSKSYVQTENTYLAELSRLNLVLVCSTEVLSFTFKFSSPPKPGP